MSLPGHMDALISAVAAANPSTVVIIQSGTPVAMSWASSVNGLLQAVSSPPHVMLTFVC
jgi:beta-glucosidase